MNRSFGMRVITETNMVTSLALSPENEKSPKKKNILRAIIFSLVVSVSGSVYIYTIIHFYIDIYIYRYK